MVEVALENSNRQVKCHSAKRRGVQFSDGDLMWKRKIILASKKDCVAAKLALCWVGSYTITGKKSRNIYLLLDERDGTFEKAIIDPLKPYYGDNDHSGHELGQPYNCPEHI